MYPQGVKSITCDRGTEFVNQFQVGLIEDTFGCKIYYANPYAPHERGSNENHNGLLREYFLNRLILRMSRNVSSMTL